MATIDAIAHKNELTKDIKDDYYLRAQIRRTLYAEDIIKRLAAKELATKNVNGAAFVQTFLDECALALAEGNNVITSLFRSATSIKGSIRENQLGHDIPANQLQVSINFNQGESVVKAISGATVHVFEQSGATGPVIQRVSNPTRPLEEGLSFRGMVLIEGMRLSLKGEDPKVGITFTPADAETRDAPVFIKPEDVFPNTPTKLQFSLPAEVTAGNWYVKVATQYSGSNTTKEVRVDEYVNAINVY